MRVLKWFGVAVAVLLTLIVALVLLIRFVIDPNDYKPQISQLVHDASGYQLNLAGDIGWSFYPVLGFESNGVSLAAEKDAKPFLQVGKMALGVQLIPLFSGQLQVDQLLISDVLADFVVDKQGNANWAVAEQSASASTASEAPEQSPNATEEPTEIPDISIPLLTIADASVRYQDKSADTDVSAVVHKLQLANVQLQEPVEILLEAGFAQADGPAVDILLQGKVKTDLAQQRYSLVDLVLAADVSNLLDQVIPIRMQSQINIDLAADTASIALEQLQMLNAKLSGEVQVKQLTTALSYSGRLNSEPVSLPELMKKLAIELPQTSSPDVLQQARFDLPFTGTAESLKVPAVTLQLDNTKLTGSLAVTDFASQALNFDLVLDQINLDHYMPPVEESSASSTPPSSPSQDEPDGELLPVDLIRELNVQGRLRAGSITLQQEDLTDLNVVIRAQNGKVTISDLRANALDGVLAGRVELDARTAKPHVETDLKVTNIELASISKRFMPNSLLSGKASLDLDVAADGNDMDQLIKTALGNMNLQLNDGVLHGINLNALVVDALQDQLTTVSSLYPDYQEKLPRQLREDTDITKLLAQAKVENGQLIMPKFEFFTGESGIDASGKIDLLKLGFDYEFGVVLSALDRNKYLHGTRWPVHCKGELAGAPADWCGPDTGAMGSILKQAAKRALKDQTASEIGDKVGIPVEDKKQLESELDQKIDEEEERAKRKLQEKLNKLFSR